MALTDGVKVSSEDLNWLAPGHAPDEVASDWLALGPALAAVTLGASGALSLACEAGTVQRLGRAVEVVDIVRRWRRDLLGADR